MKSTFLSRFLSSSTLLIFCLCLTAQAQSVKDIDGNVYKTVTIGTQIWMAENLKTTKFNDGTVIQLSLHDANQWADHTVAASKTPAFCWLYDSASVYKNRYGAFYNGFTITKGNLCPTGWHVPTDQDWTILVTYLGGEDIAGGKLKETGTINWSDPNTGATNEFKFTARAAGSISDNGSNWHPRFNGFWWSSTINDEKSLWTRVINCNSAGIRRSFSNKHEGNSVRCISDAVGKANPVADAKKEGTASITTDPKQSKQVVIKNEAFRFEASVPDNWSFSKIVQQDPYEEMKSGKYSASLVVNGEEKVPDNWNGFSLKSIGQTNGSSPYLIFYAHKVADQKPEDFMKLYESMLSRFGIKDVTINRNYSVGDAKGFDCIYNLGMKIRYTALYQNGIRIVIQYYYPSNDPSQFDKYAPEIDKIIKSLRIK